MNDCAREISAVLRHLLDKLADSNKPLRIMIAYSGGLDSTVLLHTVVRIFRESASYSEIRSIAAHINHGLHAASDRWEQHCRRECHSLDIQFLSARIRSVRQPGQSLEESARIFRYRTLRQWLKVGDVMLTAHHQNDQAETVLLQMLRGAGVQGLAAMPQAKCDEGIYLLRPMLSLTRAEILHYANAHQLAWVEDVTNNDLRYDRNYVRHRVVPVLNDRWQGWCRTLSRTARHQSETIGLLDRYANQLADRCINRANVMSIQAALPLTFTEKKLLLRYWLKRQNLPLPSEKQLRHLLEMFLTRLSQAGGIVSWNGVEVRRYRGHLFAMAPLQTVCGMRYNTSEWIWWANTDLSLAEIDLQLCWQVLAKRAPELADQNCLTVRFRRGGEKFRRQSRRGVYHQSLKKWFQSAGIPPWKRDCAPLIYSDGELRLVWV